MTQMKLEHYRLHLLNYVTPTEIQLHSHHNIQTKLEAIKMHSPIQTVVNSTESPRYIYSLWTLSTY